jgi:choline kinase
MKAIMLAAGLGSRLSGGNDDHPPKILLEFGGQTLLQRHLAALTALGIESLTMVVGYRSGDIVRALDAAEVGGFVRLVENPDYRRGSVVSLWTAREALTSGGDVIFMDADVLYHPLLLKRLIEAPVESAFLYDGDFEPGDEPVKVCLKGGQLKEFGKKVSGSFDAMGEWVGFLKLSESTAVKLGAVLERFVDSGRKDEPMEEAVRELLLASPAGTFGIADVTGMPWIEIDFPEDVVRARDVILPAFEKVTG